MSSSRIRSFFGWAALTAVILVCVQVAVAQAPLSQSEAAATAASVGPSGRASASDPNLVAQAATLAPGANPDEPAPALPQAPSGTKTKDSDWHVVWHPLYLFASSLNGTAGAGGLTMPVDAGFGEIIDEVNFAYASALDVRKNHVGALADLQYINLGDSKTFAPGLLFSGAELSAKTFILDPEVYYRVKESDRGSFDAMVGLRYWHLSNKITFLPGLLPGTTVKDSDNWADPIFGGRIILNLDKDKKWFLPIKGDVGGGGGSELTWQAFGGLGRNVGKRYQFLFGWRGLGVDRRNGTKIFDMKFHGPVMSFAIKLR